MTATNLIFFFCRRCAFPSLYLDGGSVSSDIVAPLFVRIVFLLVYSFVEVIG
jgi:hypothetical protein